MSQSAETDVTRLRPCSIYQHDRGWERKGFCSAVAPVQCFRTPSLSTQPLPRCLSEKGQTGKANRHLDEKVVPFACFCSNLSLKLPWGAQPPEPLRSGPTDWLHGVSRLPYLTCTWRELVARQKGTPGRSAGCRVGFCPLDPHGASRVRVVLAGYRARLACSVGWSPATKTQEAAERGCTLAKQEPRAAAAAL
jgi:hypothetical protein